MLKRTINTLLTGLNTLKNYKRSRSNTDQRVMKQALHMTRQFAQTKPRLAGAQPSAGDKKPAPDKTASVADYLAEVDAELDRIFHGRPHQEQRGGRRILVWSCPGGNG